MAKIITIRIKRAGSRTSIFSLSDDRGNILATDVSRDTLIQGLSFSVDDSVMVIVLTYIGNDCCGKTVNIPIRTITRQQMVDMVHTPNNTASLWRHLTNPLLYNHFYGCIHPYIIEYPFAYQYYDEIVQNIKDFTKTFIYLPPVNHVFDSNRRIQTNAYFNKAILYNDQQSSGVLTLDKKPVSDMKSYMAYPKFNTNNKTITYTKSDNFYQFNTFWNIVKDPLLPLFVSTCTSLSIDKEVNQENMEYTARTYRKDPLRAKDLMVRLILDNTSSIHLITQFIISPSQLSYK